MLGIKPITYSGTIKKLVFDEMVGQVAHVASGKIFERFNYKTTEFCFIIDWNFHAKTLY